MIYGSITAFAVGDDLDVQRSVTGISSSAPLTDAWLMVKVHAGDADSLAVISKHITTSLVSGTGQITDNGATSGTAQLLLNLMGTDTAGLTASIRYGYWIKVEVSGGRQYTIERGYLIADAEGITA